MIDIYIIYDSGSSWCYSFRFTDKGYNCMLKHCIYVILDFRMTTMIKLINIKITHYVKCFIFNFKSLYNIDNMFCKSSNACIKLSIDNTNYCFLVACLTPSLDFNKNTFQISSYDTDF